MKYKNRVCRILAHYDMVYDDFKFNLTQVRLGGLYGLIDDEGNEIVSPRYTHINSPNKYGYAKVRNGELVGIYSYKEHKEIIVPQYRTIWTYQAEYDHFIVESVKGKMGVIKPNGHEIIPPNKYDRIENVPGSLFGFEYGIALAEIKGNPLSPLRCIIDCNGNELTEPKPAGPNSEFWDYFYELRENLSKRA